jgi:hypothetical protein
MTQPTKTTKTTHPNFGSYFAPGIAEQADARRAHGRLLESKVA